MTLEVALDGVHYSRSGLVFTYYDMQAVQMRSALTPNGGPRLGGTTVSNPNPNPDPFPDPDSDPNPEPNPNANPDPNPDPNPGPDPNQVARPSQWPAQALLTLVRGASRTASSASSGGRRGWPAATRTKIWR